MTHPVVGIDLGTTNSVVASVSDHGEVVVLPNAAGDEITPSVVYFEPDGSVVVGEEAVQATAVDPDNGVQLIKRNMGAEFPLSIRGQDHTPESISALILRQLTSAACGTTAGPVRAVITVPAYFGLAEREATHQAGLIAGLDVLELLDEPVAAAAHYGLNTTGDRTVLVYDLGGGTFDTTVLKISGGRVTVLATDGHHSLGGADVDRRILDLVLRRLEDVLSPDEMDAIVEDKRRLGELVLDVEAAKCDLSARVSRPVVVRTSSGRRTVNLTRSDVNAVCGDLFDTTAEIIERVLSTAGLEPGLGVDEVIMVGGFQPGPGPGRAADVDARAATPVGRARPGGGQGGGAACSSPGRDPAIGGHQSRPGPGRRQHGYRAGHPGHAPCGRDSDRGQLRRSGSGKLRRAPGQSQHAAAGGADQRAVRHDPAGPGVGPDSGVRTGRPVAFRRDRAQPAGAGRRADRDRIIARPARSSGSPCVSRWTAA